VRRAAIAGLPRSTAPCEVPAVATQAGASSFAASGATLLASSQPRPQGVARSAVKLSQRKFLGLGLGGDRWKMLPRFTEAMYLLEDV
jgi:hypothetical protein